MRKLQAALVTLAFLLVPSALPAQSLSEAAKKEKERRKVAKSGKSYTEDDLRRAGDGYTTGGAEGDTAATTEAAAKDGEAPKKDKAAEKSEDELRAEASVAWRKKVQQAQDEVKKLTDDMTRVQNDLNDNTGGYYTSRRTTLINFLEDTKKKLEAAQQQLSDLEDEGRRNGYR